MTNPNFYNSLKTILDTLNKPKWHAPLLAIGRKYAQLEASELDFETETTNMLLQLKSDLEEDPQLPLERLTAIRFAALECWSYRIEYGSDKKSYLNPLHDSLEKFKTYAAVSSVSPSMAAYPPTDMIKRWVREHLQ